MTPTAYPRRILLAVTGLTPQVVTETLYALAVSPALTSTNRFVPTEIHLITTTDGAQQAALKLLDPAKGQFHALCRDYGLSGIRFDESCIHTIPDADGQPLADIRTPEDNTRAADVLLGIVRDWCAQDDCALHVSLAGGRKTMGFFLGYALSLFGRAQDRLSHVLVSDPFESLPDFYFPPATPRVLHTKGDKPRPVRTDAARIMLAEIPFVRLRDGLPTQAMQHPTPFATLVAAAQQSLAGTRLEFDYAKCSAICGSTRVKLPPSLLAWYAWLHEEGEPQSFRDADPARFLAIYERIVGRSHPNVESARATLRNGFDSTFFETKTSKLNGDLRKALSLAAEQYLIVTTGERPHTRYGLALWPASAPSRQR